ncbi:glutathione S-transferase [uncultured Brevundimonas sp.]|uniref:glutathione S-transferase n=1 Tax=uncultured Brevundimonas sp. TaxID=213418 RepID=UPI00260161B4|nr:glutathione S-transferase [uncultured Brevundimonas sp.]
MILVHHLADSRSQRLLWLLEELGVEYDIKRYERDPATMLAPASLKALHPLGKAPILQDDDITLVETGAIFEYLLVTYDRGGHLRPPQGFPARRDFTFWLHYAEGSAMPPLLLKLVFSQLPVRAPALMRPIVRAISNKAMSGFINPQLATHFDFIETSLAKGGWFVGNTFSAADIMMSFALEAAAARGLDTTRYPASAAYLKAIHARPAYQRALQRGGDYAYAAR